MAALNSTETLATHSFAASHASRAFVDELENKSCSLSAFSEADLLDLRGKCVRLVQKHEFGFPDECFSARIMAVQMPAKGSNIEFSVLLLREGNLSADMDHVDVSMLTVQGFHS